MNKWMLFFIVLMPVHMLAMRRQEEPSLSRQDKLLLSVMEENGVEFRFSGGFRASRREGSKQWRQVVIDLKGNFREIVFSSENLQPTYLPLNELSKEGAEPVLDGMRVICYLEGKRLREISG